MDISPQKLNLVYIMHFCDNTLLQLLSDHMIIIVICVLANTYALMMQATVCICYGIVLQALLYLRVGHYSSEKVRVQS